MSNLVSNSFKYCTNTVILGVERVEDEEHEVDSKGNIHDSESIRISVVDDGPGDAGAKPSNICTYDHVVVTAREIRD